MATTYLQAVNSVLRRLREREVSSVAANGYSKLVGDFVNDTIREVGSRWDWTALRDSVVLTTQKDVFRYSLPNVGTDAKLMYDTNGRPNVFNDTDNVPMRKAYTARWMSNQLNSDPLQTGAPIYFDFVSVTNGDFVVDLWPVPDKAYSLVFDMVVQQSPLVNDADTIKVPAHVVILGAWSKAVYERGEDQGYMSDLAYREFEKALADAISAELMNSSDNLTWGPV